MGTLDEMLTMLNVSLSRALPRWSRRAHTTLTQMHSNALIFMVNDLNDPEELARDWRYNSFADIVTMIPAYDAGNMIPILTTLEEEFLGDSQLPQLSSFIPEAQRGKLPMFYAYHSASE